MSERRELADVVDRLRVLHVILRVNETNGQYNEHCLPLADLRDISICTYFEPELEAPESITMFAGDGSLNGFFRALDRSLTEEPDVVHVHAPQSGALMVLFSLARLKLRQNRRRMVYTVQDSFYDYSRRNQALMVAALAGFNQIIFCSRAAYDSMPRLWRWLVRGRWQVVQNAADFDRVDRVISELPGSDDEEFTVLSVGRLEPVKDTATLLEAFARSNTEDSRLEIVGGGSLEAEIRQDIASRRLADRVTLIGQIPRDEVFARCAEADVLVSTSHGEGLPVAVIEAMAASCPVILSDIPPHRELLDGVDFVPLVTVGDAESFAREIQRVHRQGRAGRRELGRRGREHVLSRYSLPIMHARVQAAYRRLPSLAAWQTGE